MVRSPEMGRVDVGQSCGQRERGLVSAKVRPTPTLAGSRHVEGEARGRGKRNGTERDDIWEQRLDVWDECHSAHARMLFWEVAPDRIATTCRSLAHAGRCIGRIQEPGQSVIWRRLWALGRRDTQVPEILRHCRLWGARGF